MRMGKSSELHPAAAWRGTLCDLDAACARTILIVAVVDLQAAAFKHVRNELAQAGFDISSCEGESKAP